MKQLYKHECIVCGSEFESVSKMRKYCDMHQRNGSRELARMQRKLQKQRMDEQQNQQIGFNCEYCGKHHIVAAKSLRKISLSPGGRYNWDGQVHRYCCVEHVELAQKEHTCCANCNKSLKGSSFNYSPHRPYNYCSEQCELEHRAEMDSLRYNKFICKYCGKEFVRKSKEGTFCSRSCYNSAVRSGWRSDKRESSDFAVDKKCYFCGTNFTQHFSDQKKAIDFTLLDHAFCSKECASSNATIQVAKMKKAKLAKKLKQQVEIKSNESLCISCKTNYKDCERMQSNFRLSPKGAKFNSDGKVIECPKFK